MESQSYFNTTESSGKSSEKRVSFFPIKAQLSDDTTDFKLDRPGSNETQKLALNISSRKIKLSKDLKFY